MNTDSSTTVSQSAVRERLDEITDPCSESRDIGNSIVGMGLVDSIDIENGHVTVSMRLTSPACHMVSYFSREIRDRVGTIEGVQSIELETDSGLNWDENRMTPDARRRRDEYLERLRSERD